MRAPVKILGISGSLRRKSFNTALLRVAQSLSTENISVDAATLHGIPLYDGDVEEQDGIPESVTTLKQQIIACDGLLLVTPEYNNSMPGVFKNAIDWLSRPPKDAGRIFGGRPVAVIGASPGGFGTILAQNAWLPVLRTLGARHWTEGRLMVSRVSKLFNEDGELTDDSTSDQLRKFLYGFGEFVAINAREDQAP